MNVKMQMTFTFSAEDFDLLVALVTAHPTATTPYGPEETGNGDGRRFDDETRWRFLLSFSSLIRINIKVHSHHVDTSHM